MIVTVHWSVVVIERRRWCVRFAEYAFRPLPAEDRSSGGPWRHYRLASKAVDVEAPVGSKVVVRRRPETTQEVAADEERLAVYFDPHGLTAESVAWAAVYGDRGIRLARKP